MPLDRPSARCVSVGREPGGVCVCVCPRVQLDILRCTGVLLGHSCQMHLET